MKNKIEKLILKIYGYMPELVKRNQTVISIVGNIAEKQLYQIKQDCIRMNWKKVQLESDLRDMRSKDR